MTENVPLDVDGFTAYMADRFREALPDYRISITEPLALKAISQQGGESTYALNRAHDFCVSQPSKAVDWLKAYVLKMSESVKDLQAPIDRSMLRIVVRARDYVERMQQSVAEKGYALAVEPLTDDLTVVCYLDMPTALRTALPKDFEVLGLSPAEALEVAKDNLVAGQDEFLDSLEDLDDGIAILTGDVYQSSWFALPEFFEDLAELYDGSLLVAVPAVDTLLYARENEDSIIAMHQAAEDVADRSERPISKSVYRWIPDGWELVPGPIRIGGKNVFLKLKS
jgi:hypothetical protein